MTTFNNANASSNISSTSYKLENGIISPIELGNIRVTVGEYLGKERIITLTVGHLSNPQEVRDAIANSELAGFEVLAVKDQKAYLARPGYLDNVTGDKAKSSVVEVLKRESHPAFNTIGSLRLMVADLGTIDGAVIVYRGDDQTTQISFAKQVNEGMLTNKGTAVCWTPELDCPEIPAQVDGYLNLQGMSLDGVKVLDLPLAQRPSLLQSGNVLTIIDLVDFWVSLRTDLNIYRVGIPPMNAITWPKASFDKWLELLEQQFRELIIAKRDATAPLDIIAATSDHLRPYGAMEDFHHFSAALGAYPESCQGLVENTFNVAGINLLRRGPVVRCAFAYVMPGKALGRGQIIVPVDVLQRANLLKRFESGKKVYLECWRNPVLPGMLNDQITSAARFEVVGISSCQNVYVNTADWLVMGGDFDGDRICMSLAKPFGLGQLCDVPLGVRKDKSNYPEQQDTDLLDRVAGTSLRLGVLFNATVSVLDWCHVLGIDPNQFGLTGAAAVQAAVVRQKHNPVWEINGKVYASMPKQGEHLLTYQVAKAVLAAEAGKLSATVTETDKRGNTRKVTKSPSLKPTGSLTAYREVKGCKKTLNGSKEVLMSLPNRSEGRLANAVTWASRVPKAPLNELNFIEDWRFEEFVELTLADRIREANGIEPANKRLISRDLDNLVYLLLSEQQKGINAGDAPEDNTWGVKKFQLAWSDAMLGFNGAARLESMSRVWDKLTEKEAHLFVRLNALSADYRIVRAIGVQIGDGWDEVWQPNPMDLASRVQSEEHAEESWEDFMDEL